MTRSIPSIIALTLMCFTISYGILHFPDAGILDAAQSPVSSTHSQNVTVMKQTSDGSAIQPDNAPQSTVLPGIQSSSEELFNTQTTTSPEKESSVSKQDAAAADSRGDDASKNDSKKNADLNRKSSSKKAKNEPKKERSQDNKAPSDAAKTPEQKNEPKKDKLEQDEALSFIEVPDDSSIRDNSLPIEVDQEPMTFVDAIDPEIPEIQVPSDASEFEQKPEPELQLESEPKLDVDASLDIGLDEDEKTAEDCWNEFVNSRKESEKESNFNNDNSQTDSTTQSETNKTPEASTAPLTIKSDPNAKEIPPRVREKKPANQDALTLPALEDQPNAAPKSNQSDDNTIPLETFPLEDVPPVSVSYTTEIQQEPYDSFGFNIPATGQIIVKRLPPVENSVDPIYNNAQLDRFAL